MTARLWLVAAVIAVALPAAAGDKLALVVGVDRYLETELSSLDFADDDAVKLGEALARLGFDVVTMTGGAERVSLHPDTPADILGALDRRLKFVDRDDTVVVALSGHGVQLVGDAPRPDGSKELWFCPAKARVDDPATLVPVSTVIARMAASPAARRLLLVDACRNDMAPPGTGRAGEAIERELDPAAPARRLVPEGMVALFSCSPKERSFERKDLGHGLFSHHVIEYLSGRADDPARFYDGGEATLTDLVSYVQKRTARSAEKLLAAHQTPELVGRMTDWSFGRVGDGLVSLDRPPSPVRPEPVPAPKPVPPDAAGRIVENSVGMKLVRIEAGEFMMGSDEQENEKPIHRVRITRPFLLGQTEVTQGQWERVMGTTPWRGKVYVKEGADVAATHVSWDDAVEFCRKLTETERRLAAGATYRLPTEAEWEYACRAGTQTRFSFGDDESLLGDHAWWGGIVGDGNAKAEQYAHAVGLKKPNPWGLHDMHGNVFERCSDWYDEKYYETSPAADPQGPAAAGSVRVIRGGSWDYSPVNCRSADRSVVTPSDRDNYVGFRVVRELE